MTDSYGRIDENTVRCDAIKKTMANIRESEDYLQLKKASVQIQVKERTGRDLEEDEVAAKIELELKNEELQELQKELDELKAERGMLFDLVKKGPVQVVTDPSPDQLYKAPSVASSKSGSPTDEIEILKRKQEVLQLQLQLQNTSAQYHRPIEPLSVENPPPVEEEDETDPDAYWNCRVLPFPTILAVALLVAFVAWASAAVDVDYRIQNGIWLGLSFQLAFLLLYLQSRRGLTAPIVLMAGSLSGYLLMPAYTITSYVPPPPWWAPQYKSDPLLESNTPSFMASNSEDELKVFWDDGSTQQYVAAIMFLICFAIDFLILLVHGFKSVIHCTCDFETKKSEKAEPRKGSWITHVILIEVLMVSGWIILLSGVAAIQEKQSQNIVGDIAFEDLRWYWYSVIAQFFALAYTSVYLCRGMFTTIETWRVPTIGMLVFSTSLSMALTNPLIDERNQQGMENRIRATLAGNIITQIVNLVAIVSIGNRSFRRKGFKTARMTPSIGNAAAITICQVTAWICYFVGVVWFNSNFIGSSSLLRSDWWAIAFQALFMIIQGASVAAANESNWAVVVMAYAAIVSSFILHRTSIYLDFARTSGSNLSNPAGIAASGAILSVLLNYLVFFVHGTATMRKFLFTPKRVAVQRTVVDTQHVQSQQMQEASQPFLSAAE